MSRRRTLTRSTPQIEHRVRGSRFIARAQPVTTRAEVGRTLRQVRKMLPDATHICHAYRLMPEVAEPEEFASDAGEPRGSAGAPLLGVLRQAGLVDVLAWVARYFGGTKLGLAGLRAAYAEAVRMTLKEAVSAPWVAMTGVRLSLPYPLADRVKGEVQRLGGMVLEEDYAQRVELLVKVPRWEVPGMIGRLREWGGGRVQAAIAAIDLGPGSA